jgi:hypothetical protein
VVSAQTDRRKCANYPRVVEALRRWAAPLAPAPEWVRPPRGTWLAAPDVVVEVAPELAFRAGGQLHVVACYFDGEGLAERRAMTAAAIMRQALQDPAAPGSDFAVLDVQPGVLHNGWAARGVPWDDLLTVARADAGALVSLSGPVAA